MGLPLHRFEERIPTDDFEEHLREGRAYRSDHLEPAEKRNPLSYALCELAMAFQAMEMDDEIRLIIVKGAGLVFSSGYDLTPERAEANSPAISIRGISSAERL